MSKTEMSLYHVQHDGRNWYVEAPTFEKAIEAWRSKVREEWGDDYEETDQPDSVALVNDEAVVRAKSAPAAAGTAPAPTAQTSAEFRNPYDDTFSIGITGDPLVVRLWRHGRLVGMRISEQTEAIRGRFGVGKPLVKVNDVAVYSASIPALYKNGDNVLGQAVCLRGKLTDRDHDEPTLRFPNTAEAMAFLLEAGEALRATHALLVKEYGSGAKKEPEPLVIKGEVEISIDSVPENLREAVERDLMKGITDDLDRVAFGIDVSKSMRFEQVTFYGPPYDLSELRIHKVDLGDPCTPKITADMVKQRAREIKEQREKAAIRTTAPAESSQNAPSLDTPNHLAVMVQNLRLPDPHHAPNRWQVPICVSNPQHQNLGNAVAMVYLGGAGGTNPSREAVLATAHLLAAAPELKAAAEASERLVMGVADQLDKWAEESTSGGWSTHQVRPMRELASIIRQQTYRRDALSLARGHTAPVVPEKSVATPAQPSDSVDMEQAKSPVTRDDDRTRGDTAPPLGEQSANTDDEEGLNPALYLRPSVLWFAHKMEQTLRKHDATKGGQENWRSSSVQSLVHRIGEEYAELQTANNAGAAQQVVNEAIDVANMAMMVADSVSGEVVDPQIWSVSSYGIVRWCRAWKKDSNDVTGVGYFVTAEEMSKLRSGKAPFSDGVFDDLVYYFVPSDPQRAGASAFRGRVVPRHIAFALMREAIHRQNPQKS